MSEGDRGGPGGQALGSVVLGLAPRARCVFRRGSARALHAALLGRIGEHHPALAERLHDEPAGAHSVVRPWTVSAVQGPLEGSAEGPVALPGRRYSARITALTTDTLEAVEGAVRGRASGGGIPPPGSSPSPSRARRRCKHEPRPRWEPDWPVLPPV